jgi:hypothetical protein
MTKEKSMDLCEQNGLVFEYLEPMGYAGFDLAVIVEVERGLEDIESDRVVAVCIHTGEDLFEIEFEAVREIPELMDWRSDAIYDALEIARSDAELAAADVSEGYWS